VPHLALALALGLTLAGCAVKAPPINRWTLGAAGNGAPASYDPSGPAIRVAAVTSAPEIRSTALAWRSADGRRLERHPTEHWADYPDHLVESLLVVRLSRSGAFSAVREAPPTKGTDWVLECELVDFTEWGGPATGEGRVALRCFLRPSAPPATGRSIDVEARVPTPAATAAGMVDALATAARQAVDELVEKVRAATAP
jgi:ABC-type uncharacterized transport system auxiliary subunit